MFVSTTDTGYFNILSATFDSSYTMSMLFGDGGFGNRLQFHIAGNYSTAYVWSTPFNKANISGRWFHVALVRKSQVCKVFIDGVQQSLAVGTSTSYNNTTFPGNYALNGTPNIVLGPGGGGTKDLYTADFAIYTAAKYTSSFTPPHPLK